MADWRAPPATKLSAIEALLQEDVERGIHVLKVDLHLVLALLRYAQAHGAVTVGDLAPDKLNAG